MKIELRNVKYAAFASQETSCFSAAVYVDGKKAGEARNEGCGGPTTVWPRDLEERINAYAKTLPDITADLGDGRDFTYKQSAETLIDGLLDEHLTIKELQRHLSKRLLWLNSKGEIRTTKTYNRDMLNAYIKLGDGLKSKLRDCVECLNVLPFDRALQLYKEHG